MSRSHVWIEPEIVGPVAAQLAVTTGKGWVMAWLDVCPEPIQELIPRLEVTRTSRWRVQLPAELKTSVSSADQKNGPLAVCALVGMVIPVNEPAREAKCRASRVAPNVPMPRLVSR